MPEIGDVKKSQELVYKTKGQPMVWHACVDCGKKRWTALRKGQPVRLRCQSCGAKNYFQGNPERHPNWKGGKFVDAKSGYVFVKLQPDNFFYPMCQWNGVVREHRLVVAKALGRCLLPWEVVHHKGTKCPKGSNENRSDNRYPENLKLVASQRHHLPDSLTRAYIHRLEKKIAQLESHIILVEAENILIKVAQNEEVR